MILLLEHEIVVEQLLMYYIWANIHEGTVHNFHTEKKRNRIGPLPGETPQRDTTISTRVRPSSGLLHSPST